MKKFITFCLAVVMVLGFALPVRAITFVNLFAYTAGEVVDIRPWLDDRYLVEIIREDGRHKGFIVGEFTYIVGEDIAVGDFIVGHYSLSGEIAFEALESEVLDMRPYRGQPEWYSVYLNHGTFTSSLTVDFSRSFTDERFEVGDVVTFYHSFWGASAFMLDMPEIVPRVIVNGDYQLFLGVLGDDNRLTNSHRILTDEFSIYLNITDEAEIVTNRGEPFTDGLVGFELAAVFEEVCDQDPPIVTPTKIIVLNPPMQWTPITYSWQMPGPGMFGNRLPPQEFGGAFVDERPIPDWDFQPETMWAREYVNRALSLGLLPDELQGNLNQPLTRAEFAALAVQLYQSVTGRAISGRAIFSDTSDTNVAKMAYLGVVEGLGGGNFNPDGLITREQSAVLLARLANATGRPFTLHATTLSFADGAQISPWAVDSISVVQAAGIMSGVGNGEFAPHGTYTRAQGIVSMVRMYDSLSRAAVLGEPSGLSPSPQEGLSLHIIDVSPQGISYFIDNPTGRQYLFGRPFSLYVMDASGWVSVPLSENVFFTLEGLSLMPRSQSMEMAQNFELFMGELAPGRYSFRKEIMFWRSPGDFDVYVVTAEFELP